MARDRDFSWIYKAGLEAAMIVFAVILAFLVTEWREAQRAEDRARTAIERIVLELEANIAQLETVTPYHSETAAGIRDHVALIERGEASAQGRFIENAMAVMPRGLAPPMLNRTAWDYAVTSGVLDPVDYDLVADLAAVYAIQNSGVDSTWRQMASTMFLNQDNMMEGELAPRFQLLALMFQELASQEAFLLTESRAARDKGCAWLGHEIDAQGCDLGAAH